MRVQLDGGEVIDLGTTEETPTISIVDYSRRETDDFGVTTVVERGFARRMSVRLQVPTDDVDALQQRLAAVRATKAMWIADEDFGWLSFEGFYKDFEIDLAVPPVSFCTLTIEGLAGTEVVADPGDDPAPDAALSTLQLLQPIHVGDTELTATDVPEADYPEWSADATYAAEARVIQAATHRIYESAAGANIGHDPSALTGHWLDVGPTNRWAMFDQALGSATVAAGEVSVTLSADIDAVALLDVSASTVRVQADGYDTTEVPNAAGIITFLDLPDGTDEIAVTISGTGTVSVGTLLIGNLLGLGLTEAAPTAGITDFSRKEVDDFGEVTIVERSWAKRMAAKALIRTDAIDVVANRIAAVRARPALWIADAALGTLTVYGFFKDFAIERGENVSRLALSIEGLSTAGKVEPLGKLINWPDIADPDGTKPEDNATNGAPAGSPVGDATADSVVDALKALAITSDPAKIVAGAQSLIDRNRKQMLASYGAQLLGQERKARWDRLTHIDGVEVATRVRQEINERVEQGEAFVQLITEIEATATDGINAAMAAIELEQTVRASADAAETTARELAISLFQAEVNGQVVNLEAAISSEATTRADADTAETAERTLAISTLQGALDGQVAELEAAIATEATTRADAISAEAALRTALAASLESDLADLDAAVTTESAARVSGDQAEATAREALAATLTSDIAEVAAAVVTETTARVTETEALAGQATSLSASLDDAHASIDILAATQVTDQAAVATLTTTLEARTAARFEVVTIGGDGRARLTIFADGSGAGVDIEGDVRIDGSLLVTGTVTADELENDGVTKTLDAVNASTVALTGTMADIVTIDVAMERPGTIMLMASYQFTFGSGGSWGAEIALDSTQLQSGSSNTDHYASFMRSYAVTTPGLYTARARASGTSVSINGQGCSLMVLRTYA